MRRRRLFVLILAVMVICSAFTMFAGAESAAEVAEEVNPMVGTFWALVPPVIAIVLALITKEVYSSLFIGIVAGALFCARFKPVAAFDVIISDGLISSLADSGSVGILIFLVVLGIMVCIINKAGGSYAFGRWAQTHIKSRVGAQIATFVLGVLIFVDDYFNCLTVGSVMLPVTDSHKISRAKLAYIIDATAAPICMIAPISSWAAAVTGVVEGTDGFVLFIKAIPYNFYSLLTIVMIIALTLMKFDYGPMARHEANAKKGDLFSGRFADVTENANDDHANGGIIDLLLPVIVLIISCLGAMLYTGGFFSGNTFVSAFSDCDVYTALAWGSMLALIITVIYFLIRRTVSFRDLMGCIPKGFNAMVPAILILTFAWTLGGITGSLGADVYVAGLMDGAASGLANFLPAIIFLVACLLAFATGTSWGTFTILIPIVVKVFAADPALEIIGISACLAGAVCGDHCSPISDTTIMASAGAKCDHVTHVSTQLPYAITVAAVSFVCYIISAFIQSAWVLIPVGAVLLVAVLAVIKALTKKNNA